MPTPIRELQADLFKGMTDEKKQIQRRCFKAHYQTPMVYDGALGWRVAPHATVFNDKKTERDSSQLHRYGDSEVALFGGSTAWGWGLPKQNQMFADQLAKSCSITIRNHTQPAYNLYKSATQMRLLHLSGNIASKNIIYLGINESFCLSRKQWLFSAPKDQMISRNLTGFETFYFHSKPTQKTWLELMRKNTVKKRTDSDHTESTPSFSEEAFLLSLKKLMDEIMGHSGGKSRVVFVLEPALFFKVLLSESEKRYAGGYLEAYPDTLACYDKVYATVLEHGRRQGVKVLDIRDVLEGQSHPLYWDYCHPGITLSGRIADRLEKALSGWLTT